MAVCAQAQTAIIALTLETRQTPAFQGNSRIPSHATCGRRIERRSASFDLLTSPA
ncbi:hypothetical protein K788_0003376 [Paraburkholderia caribensis MBA4]|uniref:Uncharacterized protein n=1 Tax=Paraburkholderia caribensis MBA4 TaxID=1323664 RepID=A0A0P0RCL2_9BURK|nr:hypothetical protein K788_0003376 [Paraburkholderia caribensis MBA4]